VTAARRARPEAPSEIRSGPGWASLVLAALLAVGLGYLLWAFVVSPNLPDPCGVELEDIGGECIGVTDGSSAKWEGLEQVSERIKAENDRIAKDPHVTIALMISMTSDNSEVRKQILHQVQGAYLAQYRANNDRAESGDPPKIRLVLANPGKARDKWLPVTDRLDEMARSDQDKLRVVFGFDVSVLNTKKAIQYLTNDKGIPVVAGSLTGNDFANTDRDQKQYQGFARIAPNNTDQADALVNFDKGLDLRHAVLVEDGREKDDYARSLRDAFQRKLADSPHNPYTFVSEGPDTEGSLSSEFRRMAVNICTLSPAVDNVYFAGRQTHLRQFVNAVAEHRPCKDRKITVVSGSAASTLYSDEQLNWEALRGDPEVGRKGVEVVYTSYSHPDGWTTGEAPETGGSAAAFNTLRSYVDRSQQPPVGPIGETDIADSRVASAYDSAWTAITGIRVHTENGKIPGLRAIGNDWDSLQGVDKVQGASGWICLDTAGNPYNKAVAVVRLDPEARAPEFVGLAWPRGAPPAKAPQGTGSCQIPKDR